MQAQTTLTPTPLPVTSTLAPPSTQIPAETPLPSPLPALPTAAPVEGMTSTQLNVRVEPSTVSTVLGIIPANTRVEITGKDIAENWWQINYAHPQAVDGKGWVTAQYVTTATTPEVPTIGGDAADPNTGNVAVVQQQINVRSGPGTDFNSLGTLNPQDVVQLTGKDPNGAWLQLNFETGPEGKGWVNAAFVQAQGVENLPIVTEAGLIVGTGTPTNIPFTPTVTVQPAWEDHDSALSPITSVIFESSGTQTLIYNGDLSSPQGDMEDWIAFRPYNQLILVSLQCTGSDAIRMELMEDSIPVTTYIKCNDPMQQVVVNPESNYLVHLQASSPAATLQHINYILTIKSRP
jgi:uncharacterized protein YraI